MARYRAYRRRRSLSDRTSEATLGPLFTIIFLCGGFLIAIPVAMFSLLGLLVKEIYNHLR